MDRSKQVLKEFVKRGFICQEDIIYDGKIKSQRICCKGKYKTPYKVISLYFKGRMTQVLVHRIIGYLKFGDKIFEKGKQIRHLDSNSLNNKWENILLGTQSENEMDKPLHVRINTSKAGLLSMGMKIYSDAEKLKMIELRKSGLSYRKIASQFKCSYSTAQRLC